VEEAHTHLPDLALRLAHIHVDELGALDRQEVYLALGGNGLGQEGLASAGRTIEQDPRPPAQASRKEDGVPQRELH
jgi:hypothetical protein